MMEIVALKMGLTSRNMQRRQRGFKGDSKPSACKGRKEEKCHEDTGVENGTDQQEYAETSKGV